MHDSQDDYILLEEKTPHFRKNNDRDAFNTFINNSYQVKENESKTKSSSKDTKEVRRSIVNCSDLVNLGISQMQTQGMTPPLNSKY